MPALRRFERAVFVTRYFPQQPVNGGFLYSYALIRGIARLARETLIVGASYPAVAGLSSLPPIPQTRRIELEVAAAGGWRAAFSTLPHAAAAFASASNAARLRELLETSPPDLLVLDHIGSLWAAPALRARLVGPHPRPTVAYAAHNFEHETRLSARPSGSMLEDTAIWLDARKITVLERAAAALVDVITTISKGDAEKYAERHPRCRTAIVPAVYAGPVRAQRLLQADLPRRVVLVGSYRWSSKKRNVRLLLEAAGGLFERPGLELELIGTIDADFRDELLARWPRLRISGPVARLDQALDRCRIALLAEEIGGGFKLKALDYAFSRVPIYGLASCLADLPVVDGVSARTFPSLEAMWQAIAREIDDLDLLNQLQNAAFAACSGYLDPTGQRIAAHLDLALRSPPHEAAALIEDAAYG